MGPERAVSPERDVESNVRIRRRAASLFVLLGVGAAGPVAGPTPASAAGEVPLDKFFKGAVIGLDGTKVRLRYDFSSKEQLADWPNGQPFNTLPDPTTSTGVAEGRLFVRGMIGVRHVGEWEGDVVVTAKLIPDGVKDIGSFVSSPEQVDDYATYSIAETYWHKWDGKPGGDSGMMKFGKQYATTQKGGYTGFRYLDFRRPTVDPVAGKPVAWSFGRRGDKLFMTMDDLKLDSMEPGNKLKLMQVGFYAMQSSMTLDDVVVEGTLAPKYLAANKLALRTDRPIAADVAAGADPAVVAILEGYKAGKESATKVVSIVGDAARPEGDRAAGAAALKAGSKKALPAVVDLLYSADLAARTYGIDIVKALAGKTYGYDPRGGEKSRQTAVRKLNEDLPKLLKDAGG